MRVVVLMHEDLVPPDDASGVDEATLLRCKTERDVVDSLRRSGHEVCKLGVLDELTPLRKTLQDWKPDIVFNLLEEFNGETVYDHNVVSYLELMQVAYTGCNPRGLVLARDKALSKKILHYHRIRAPRFAVASMGKRFKLPSRMSYPVIVKSLVEEASHGIARASVVEQDAQLLERVRLIHERIHTDAIVEQYIDGREVYVGVMGNHRLSVLPVWELVLEGLPVDTPRIATRRLKIDPDYQIRHGVEMGPAEGLDAETQRLFDRTSRRIYRLLGLSGYARLDYRWSANGKIYFLEANPNPEIAADEEFASSAAATGMDFDSMIQRILRLGILRFEGSAA